MAHKSDADFGDRLRYACWLYYLEHRRPPANAAIGKAVDRTGESVATWFKLREAPPDWKVHAPLAGFLGVSERWLIRNDEPPPKPELWDAWIARDAPGTRQGPSGTTRSKPVPDPRKRKRGNDR